MQAKSQGNGRGIFGANPHYEFRDRQDPVFDHMKTIWQASGMSLAAIAAMCHMAPTTLHNWFVTKSTRSPRHESVKIFYNAFGIDYGVISTLRVVVSNAKKVGRKNEAGRKSAAA